MNKSAPRGRFWLQRSGLPLGMWILKLLPRETRRTSRERVHCRKDRPSRRLPLPSLPGHSCWPSRLCPDWLLCGAAPAPGLTHTVLQRLSPSEATPTLLYFWQSVWDASIRCVCPPMTPATGRAATLRSPSLCLPHLPAKSLPPLEESPVFMSGIANLCVHPGSPNPLGTT